MLITKIIRLLSISTILAVAACGNDDGMNDDTNPPCSIDATYTAIHDKILSATAKCSTQFCHDTASAAGGLDFTKGSAGVYMDLVGADSMNPMATQAKRITAGAKADSWFYTKISDAMAPGGRMPIGGALAACEIENIGMWIDAGAMQ
jgi:hypothetical protein